jgi:hypothetical protein
VAAPEKEVAEDQPEGSYGWFVKRIGGQSASLTSHQCNDVEI